MSMVYYDSYTNQSSGVALTGYASVPDRQVAEAFVVVQLRSPAVAGLLLVNFKWKDRGGVVRTKPVLSVPLLAAGHFGVSEKLYFYDTGSQAGLSFDWEVVPAGVLGAYSYDVAVGLDDKFIGN